jgi:hypothetical protein
MRFKDSLFSRFYMNFPYKIAFKIPKIANYFQTKNKFDENSTFNSLKYQNKQIHAKKISIFFEIRKVLKLFLFSYKIAKTVNHKTALTSDNTWIWRLKFGLRVQNESYSILFTHIFDFKRK